MCEEQVNIPEGWEVRQLDELAANITSGGTPAAGSSRYYTSEGGLPFAKTEDLTRAASKNIEACELQITEAALKESAAKPYPVGTILVSMYGTIGLTKITASVMAANQALCALLAPFRCNVDYLYHQLDFIRPKWSRFSGQTTQANISGSIVRKAQLLVPPRNEQLVIAHILDTLDTHIHKTEALIAKLEKVKEGLLHDLLTRGIDENGLLRPSPEQAPELYKESPLGLIPRGWECVAIGKSPTSTTLGTTNRGAESSANAKLIKMGNLNWGNTLSLIDVESISARKVQENLFLNDGDLLFNTRNTPELVGKTCSWKGDGALFTFDNNILRIRFSESLNGHFVASYMSGDIGRRRIGRLATGTTSVAAIYWRGLSKLKIPMPDMTEQLLIVDKASSLQGRVDALNHELGQLHSLKAGLMDDLLTGRVRVTPLIDQAQATTPA